MTDSEAQTNTLPLARVLFHPNDGYYTTTETLWADDLGGARYRLRNSPWYIYNISLGDVVRARPAADGMLEFVEVLERSGRSTFRILLREDIDGATFERFWQPLAALGCTYEHAKGRLYAIDAPPRVDLGQAAALLAKGEEDAVWDWEAGYWHGTAEADPRSASTEGGP